MIQSYWSKSFFHPAFFFSTWFYSGLLPKAPGTWGSLAALPYAWVILQQSNPLVLLIFCILVFILGIWSTKVYMDTTGRQDPGEVVIDEVVGQWLPFLFVPELSLFNFILAFVLFRLFDILKPWPIRIFDRQHNAMGVMMDDVIAGLMAGLMLWGINVYV